MMSIEVDFPMSRWEQLRDFISETYGPEHVLLKRNLFEWIFCTTQSDRANFVVAYEGSELVSLLGYIPTQFNFYDTLVDGVWMINWMTKKEYRQGIGALLMRKITEIFPVAAGQGANFANKQIVQKMGFYFLEQIPKVVFVVDADQVNSLFGFGLKPTDQRSSLNTNSNNGEQFIIHKGQNITEFKTDARYYPSLCFGAPRDSAFIKRRFLDHPFFDYKVFFSGSSDRPVVLTARIVDARMPEPDGRKFRVGRILEFFYPEDVQGRIDAEEMLLSVKQYFIEQGCVFVDFVSTGKESIDFLQSQDFRLDADGVYPNFLNPVDYKRRYQNLEIYIRKDLLARYPDAPSKFYVTRSDGDQDRPNQIS